MNLTNPETLQLHLETRLAQLESAINMELWQVCELLFVIIEFVLQIKPSIEREIHVWQ